MAGFGVRVQGWGLGSKKKMGSGFLFRVQPVWQGLGDFFFKNGFRVLVQVSACVMSFLINLG